VIGDRPKASAILNSCNSLDSSNSFSCKLTPVN
jgi:hypothetical protein